MRVDVLFEVAVGVGFGGGEETVVETAFGVDGVLGGNPVDCAFDLPRRSCAAGFAVEIGGAAEFDDCGGPRLVRLGFTGGVFDYFVAFDDVGVFQADFAAGFQAEEFRGRDFGEVVLLDPEFAAERELAGAGGRVFGVVDGVEFFVVVFGEVGDDDFEGAQDGEAAVGAAVEVLADAVLEDGDVGDAVVFGDADVVGELADGAGGDAAATQAADGRQARVVPAGDDVVVDERDEFALGDDGVGRDELGEFVLVRERPGEVEVFEDPVVERAVDFEFEGADAVGDAFDVVAEAMGEVVERIDAPLGAGLVVFGVADPVDQRVAQPDVRRGHVNLRAHCPRAVRKFSGFHPRKQVEALGNRTIPVLAWFPRSIRSTAHEVHFLRRVIADVGFAFFDKLHGKFVKLVEITGSIKRLAILKTNSVIGPAINQPPDIRDDRIHILDFFFRGIGVVHPQITNAAELAGDTEVEADGFGVADVQIAVWLRWKARDRCLMLTGSEVGLDDVADEIGWLFWNVAHRKSCRSQKAKASEPTGPDAFAIVGICRLGQFFNLLLARRQVGETVWIGHLRINPVLARGVVAAFIGQDLPWIRRVLLGRGDLLGQLGIDHAGMRAKFARKYRAFVLAVFFIVFCFGARIGHARFCWCSCHK